MKQCIIADFEWSVTPHPTGDRFLYFNEILSAGAVRIDEAGNVLARFYSLIRPEDPAFVHPVILNSLRLERAALAAAPQFPDVYRSLMAFTGDTPIFTWGCADQSAMNQNVRIKGGALKAAAAPLLPPMRDLQPILARGLELHQPYPSLASVLAMVGVENDENRHNALSDAEDTAKIIAVLAKRTPACLSPLFRGQTESKNPGTAPASPVPASNCEGHTESPSNRTGGSSDGLPPLARSYETPGACLSAARRIRPSCPVCGEPIGIGIWIRDTATTLLTLCCCERDGKFLCDLEARQGAEGKYKAYPTLLPFDGPHKARYEAARRKERARRQQRTPKQ